MSTSIPQNFIDVFGAETKLAYQRMGPKLRDAVRVVNNVNGRTYRFPTLGKGVANTKGRHADVTPMNLSHGSATATLTDHYAPEYLDRLDEFKGNEDFRGIYAESAGAALGRKCDELVLVEWENNAGTTIGHGGLGLTFDKIREAAEDLNRQDVPMGADRRTFVISAEANTDFLNIDKAVSIDFASGKVLVNGQPTDVWMGFRWVIHTGLPVTGGGIRSCFAVDKAASGLAIGKDISADIDWVAQKKAWLVCAEMSMGATVIDPQGIVKVEVQE